jgi:AraC-like DNA-binding protein
MPDIDGLMLCSLIRSDPRLAHLPVMVLSANDAGEVRAEALATVDEFLGKPFHTAELIIRLKNLITRGQVRASGGPAPAPAAPAPPAGQAHQRAFQQRVDATILKSITDPLYTVDDLARELAMSDRQLRRRLLEFGPLGPNAYIREVRLQAAREALELGTFGSIAEVAASVGMTPAYFSRAYRAWMGSPPSQARPRSG